MILSLKKAVNSSNFVSEKPVPIWCIACWVKQGLNGSDEQQPHLANVLVFLVIRIIASQQK